MDESVLEKTFKNTLYIFGGNNSYRTIYLCANYLYNLTNVNIEKRF